MSRRIDADVFLRRLKADETVVETYHYAQLPGLKAARRHGLVISSVAYVRGWRHELTEAGRAALAKIGDRGP